MFTSGQKRCMLTINIIAAIILFAFCAVVKYVYGKWNVVLIVVVAIALAVTVAIAVLKDDTPHLQMVTGNIIFFF